MTKFYGLVGYAETVETSPGVWEEVVNERAYFGDVIRNTKRSDSGEYLNNNLTIGNSFSIVADAYANDHFFAIRYIYWMGTLWSVSEVEVQSPRLIIRVGGVYNGPTPEASDPA